MNRSSSDSAVARRSRPRPARAATGSPVQAVLGRLTRIEPGDHRVVSCYLKLEPRDRMRGKYLIKTGQRVGIPVELEYVGDEAALYNTDNPVLATPGGRR